MPLEKPWLPRFTAAATSSTVQFLTAASISMYLHGRRCGPFAPTSISQQQCYALETSTVANCESAHTLCQLCVTAGFPPVAQTAVHCGMAPSTNKN